MNGADFVKIPKFMEGELLPEGYYDPPDPYQDPPESKYDFIAMVNYANKNGKKVPDLTREEVAQFLRD